MSIDRIGILYNGIYVLHFYALILISGAFAGGYLAAVRAKRRGINPELVWDLLFWVMLAGIVGARLWHVFTPSPSSVAAGRDTMYYLNLNHWETVSLAGFQVSLPALIATTNGGLGIPGAVIGGVVALYFFTRHYKLNFGEWLDLAAPALALGQAIGRWGNFVNQELYGAPTTLPWGIEIDAMHRVAGYTDPALKFHPLFFYEFLGNALICVGLIYAGRRLANWLKNGDLFLFYLMAYPTLRFVLEFIRLDSAEVFRLNANQTFMAIVAVAAAIGLYLRHRSHHTRRYELKGQVAESPVESNLEEGG